MKLPTFLEFQNSQRPSWWNLTNLDHNLTGIPLPVVVNCLEWLCILKKKKKTRLLICPQNSVNHCFSLVEWNFMAESKSNAWPLCRKSMSSSYLRELRIWNWSFSLPCAISGTNIGIFYGLLSGLLILLMPCLCRLLLLQLLCLLHSSVVLLMRILQ